MTEAINGRARFPQPRAPRLHDLLQRFEEVTAVHLDRSENHADLHARIARPADVGGRRRRPGRHPTRRGRDYHRNKRRRRADPDRRFN